MSNITEKNYTWHKVFDSADDAALHVPLRKLKLLQLGEIAICFAHTTAGYFAVSDTCPHLGYSLSKGTTNYLNEVICPWHSYRFNLSTGMECDYRTRKAVTYPVEVRPDGVFVGVEKN